MTRLRLERAGSPPAIFDSDLVTIGRSPSNMLVISDSRVSSVHGEAVRRDGAWYYRDLGSTNGSLVRSAAGDELVVDGRHVREARIGDGDALHLGDRARPVVLRVNLVRAQRPVRSMGQTVVARRDVTSVEDLGTQVVENPLASRQTLSRLFTFFGELGAAKDHQDLAERTAATLLELLSKNLFVAVFLTHGETYRRAALLARDPARVPVVSADDLGAWFPDALAGRASVAIEAPPAPRERLGDLEMVAACPLPGDAGTLGVAVVGRGAGFSGFDLDVLALVSHHAALQLEKLDLIARLATANRALGEENRSLKERLDASQIARPMIGESPPWHRAVAQAEMVAQSSTGVLIRGETGTGKELIARFIHSRSDRADQSFATVNCGALTDSLLESELFGYVKGAFTGAERDKQGLFVAADQGTLFLDEIGDVTPNLQVKLLRAIESGEVTPVGSTRPIRVDVRIVAATHRDLEAMVAAGRFREDLFYRINVFPIVLPPLRERPGDVTLLARHFLECFEKRLGKQLSGIDSMALERLESYGWPGNIRQLENEIHRAAVLAAPGEPITPELLSEAVGGLEVPRRETRHLKEVMAQLEEQYIRRVLREHDDNRTHTAKALGISRQALTEKLRRYDLVDRRD